MPTAKNKEVQKKLIDFFQNKVNIKSILYNLQRILETFFEPGLKVLQKGFFSHQNRG